MEWVIGVVQRLNAELEVATARAKQLDTEYRAAQAASVQADADVRDLEEAIEALEKLFPGAIRWEAPL